GASLPLAQWISIGTFDISWAFRIDTLSVTMMLVVSGVGTLIHIYATRYMHSDVRHNGDPGRYRRFFVYFNLFILAMMTLVSADNYLMLFVGWEGVGLCSYLLIGFWFEGGADGLGNARAGKKAFIVNRIGDFGLLIALFLMFGAFGTLQFEQVFTLAPEVAKAAPGVLIAITLFMILGVAGKSAQLPLYVWLPDAMAGPTPVSALIHAATMVTAGVYLVARSQALFVLAPVSQTVLMWIGALTALFAGTIAVGQYDIKKVLAYSTISQLGFMVAAVGMGAMVAGVFHLVTHAFFKALLFLAAGSVILGMEGNKHDAHGQPGVDIQDMRNMGGLRKKMPVTFWTFLIGALALSGLAPLAGFFSKDEILTESLHNIPVFIILMLAAFLTAFYMLRQVLMVFFGKARSTEAEHAAEQPPLITVPLMILAALAVVGGALNLPGVYTLEHWLEETLKTSPVEFVAWVALLSTAVLAAAYGLAWLLYGRKPRSSASAPDPLASRLGPIYRGMEQKWKVDEFNHLVFVRPYHWLAGFLAGPVDLGVINTIGDGFGKLTRSLSGRLGKLQSGFIRSYTLVFLVGVVAVLAYLLLR
ncbi:MAG: NADH-quinone oxidoreductase subunit L, partial [Anaerolineaceae bacterium]|nr:NADH-quinone oxidoreductase subunit L [Anaerolineaceae bacterium]